MSDGLLLCPTCGEWTRMMMDGGQFVCLTCCDGWDYSEGLPDGQLCPYDDCAWDLRIDEAGWYRCGHCGREFWCRDWEGDYEDYVCYLPDEDGHREAPPKPETLPVAMALRSSWASPPKARWDRRMK